jgi:hypothetical protein
MTHSQRVLAEACSKATNAFNFTNRMPDANLSQTVAHRLQALTSIYAAEFQTAYKSLLLEYNAALEYFQTKVDDEDTTWFIPTFVRISNDVRVVASLADESTGDAENTLLRESIQSLTKGWTVVAKDRTPIHSGYSKKMALFALTNVLFKIYFSLNTLSLCGKIINVIEGPSSGGVMNNLKLFPVNDVVTYKYYIGRLKMFEDKYIEARECLRFALRYCPKSCVENRKRILVSLVPVEMCLGVYPSLEVGTRYGLHELVQLGDAAKIGDLLTFENLLQRHMKSFIRVGVYLVLEQVKSIVYRNLFKRVYIITNSTRINLGIFEGILRKLEIEADLDQIECLLANQIYTGKIKGYLSHQKRFLVLSKADPFPSNAVIKKA